MKREKWTPTPYSVVRKNHFTEEDYIGITKVDGRSARGRPRFGWVDGVKRALNDRRMDMREASERARNRNELRMIVMQF